MNIQQLADSLKVTVTDLTVDKDVTKFFSSLNAVGTAMRIDWSIDSLATTREAAMIMQNFLVERMNRMSQVRAIAANNGYLLPDDPKDRMRLLNSGRRPWDSVNMPKAEADVIVKAAIDLSIVTLAYDAGEVSFERIKPASQIGSFESSLDGLGGQSGDPLIDILGYQPDADFVKRKRALDSLAQLDFSKRKPYLLFTADLIEEGKRKRGTVICWQKMRDASSYSLHRRDVFAMVDYKPVKLRSDEAEDDTKRLLKSPDFLQVLSFYDWVDSDDIVATVDYETYEDTLYSFKVIGHQTRAPATPFIFDVQTSALYLSPSQIAQLKNAVNAMNDMGLVDRNVTPYTELSKIIYETETLGWVLAGCNVLAAKRRGDSQEKVRSLSFIGCDVETLATAAAEGKLVVPSDVNLIVRSVESGISAFGMSQVLLSIFDGTGLTLFSAAKDDPLGFQSTQEAMARATGGLATIISAINPQTATLDPNKLIATLSIGGKTKTGIGQITVINKNVGDISALQGPPIDLTTFEGIDSLMSLIRKIYDLFPGSLT